MYIDEIKKAGFSLEKYLEQAKKNARKHGYNTRLLKISEDPKYKLDYNGIKFGSAINNDYIIYRMMAYNKQITRDEAKKHRDAYIARATKIKGEWKIVRAIGSVSRSQMVMKTLPPLED